MNTFRFSKTALPSQLHREVGPSCETIRWNSIGDGEIVHDGTLTDTQLQAIVDAHIPIESNDEKVGKPAVGQVIQDLLAGYGTNAERLARCEIWLAKVLRYIRRDSI